MPSIDVQSQKVERDLKKIKEDLHELKKQELQEQLKDKAEAKAKERGLKRQARAEKEASKARELWQGDHGVRAKGEELIRSGQQGYDSFVSMMNSLVAASLVLHKALRASDIPGTLLGHIVNFVSKPKPLNAADMHVNEKDIKIPDVQLDLALDKDGKLDIDSVKLCYSDNTEVSKEHKTCFYAAVKVWLHFEGYEIDDEDSDSENYLKIKNKDRNGYMNGDDFNKLVNDPEHGFVKFLNDKDLELKFTQGYNPTPTPAPVPGR